MLKLILNKDRIYSMMLDVLAVCCIHNTGMNNIMNCITLTVFSYYIFMHALISKYSVLCYSSLHAILPLTCININFRVTANNYLYWITFDVTKNYSEYTV